MEEPNPLPALSRRVVVIDDDVLLGRALALLVSNIRGQRLECVSFDDPLLAVEAILADPPDLIITDHDMPHLAGTELARKLREQLGPRCPPLLLVTATRMEWDQLTVFDALLLKPVLSDELTGAVRELLPPGESGSYARFRPDD